MTVDAASAGAAADRQPTTRPTAAAVLRSEMPLEPYEASLGRPPAPLGARGARTASFLAERDGDDAVGRP